MPIEIRELHIKVTVNGAAANGSSQPAASGPVAPVQSAPYGSTQSIVADCVEQVLEILRRGRER